MKFGKLLSIVVMLAGILLLVFYVLLRAKLIGESSDGDSALIYMGGVLCVVGLALSSNLSLKKLKFGGDKGGELEFDTPEFEQPEKVVIRQKELAADVESENAAFVEAMDLPNAGAPAFTPFDPNVARALRISPSGFANTPMYLLDNMFRVLDWNEAFSLVFDRTMEGRIGESILKWTMHLKNFKEVTQEGMRAFGDPANLPTFHKEPVEYESLSYGLVKGVKRAYAVPGDDGNTVAWLISIEVEFRDFRTTERFDLDIVRMLENDLMWSEYALLYDRILNRTELYNDLARQMLGQHGDLEPPPNNAKVLDLGAGTGNLAIRLMNAESDYFVVAVENNRTMLEKLRHKTKTYRTHVFGNPGVECVKQDVTSLNGIDDDSFDLVLLNNVLYAVDDYAACLSEAFRVLKPGGEIRISGPHDGSSAERLFADIEADLRRQGEFDNLRRDFRRVRWINTFQLLPLAHKFTEETLTNALLETGFSQILACHKKIYAGESMLIAAKK